MNELTEREKMLLKYILKDNRDKEITGIYKKLEAKKENEKS